MYPEGSAVKLNTVESVKDLGVHIDRQLNFDLHDCHEMAMKANGILATIRRTFQHIDTTNLLPLHSVSKETQLFFVDFSWGAGSG